MAVDDSVASPHPGPSGDDPRTAASERVLAAVLGGRAHTDRLKRLVALEHGASAATGSDRDALGELPPAVADLVDKVARHAYQIADEDMARAREAGYSDDELFELVVATALGAGLSRRAIGRSAVAEWERRR